MSEDLRHEATWLPLIVILLTQIQMSFNISALTISMGPIVEAFDTNAAMVGTAILVYSIAVAGLVMLGAKIGAIVGSRLAFQIGAAAHGVSMLVMALSPSATIMLVAQALAGVAAAIAVPAFVVLIASNYHAKQQEQSLGLLAAAGPMAAVMAFLLVGFLSTLISWRWTFAGLAVFGLVNTILSARLPPVEPQKGIRIDWIGAVLAFSSITLISLGFNSVTNWGLLAATPDAPFDLAGMSPVPLFVIVGVVLGQLFFSWLRKAQETGRPQLFALEVLGSWTERSATVALAVIAVLGAGVNFLIPLYIQIVQGRSTAQTAVAIVPYSIAIFLSATFIVRFYDRAPPRLIGRTGFIAVAAGLFMLSYAISNDWGTPLVILSLVIVGLGEGALLTLVFNVLVSASPRDLAGHVGALRGTVNNLATGLGTALTSVMAVAALSFLIAGYVEETTVIPPDVIEELELDDVDFISNDDLEEALEDTPATPPVVEEAIQVNSDARLRALKISFQVLAGLALLGIVPASGLPPFRPGEITTAQAQTLEPRRERRLRIGRTRYSPNRRPIRLARRDQP